MVAEIAVVPGSVLAGKYRVERQIGAGGMGVVLEATHLALGQRVALKLLAPEHAAASENIARFFREARIAATLISEHIARVSDVGQTADGAPYLVMELLTGHDLATEIARAGKLAVSDAVDWILEACEGLAVAHAAGLVHRDMKPSNLFLARRHGLPPILKVLDFGLTKEQVSTSGMSLTQSGSIFGTPQYMAPEQVLDAKNVDARCDQHALAMILYEALTGRPPYEGTAASQLFVVIATASPPSARASRPEVPRGLDQAIVRALAKRPGQRFPSLAEFAEAIAPFGGPHARAIVANVRRVLASTPAEVRAAQAAADRDVTIPNVARDPTGSGTDLTSSADLGRNKQRLAIGGGIGIVAIAGIAAAVVLARSGPIAPAASAPAATSAAPEGTASAEPAPTVAPMDSTAAPEASVSASAPRPAAAAPKPTSRPASGKSSVRKAIGVFGGERR